MKLDCMGFPKPFCFEHLLEQIWRLLLDTEQVPLVQPTCCWIDDFQDTHGWCTLQPPIPDPTLTIFRRKSVRPSSSQPPQTSFLEPGAQWPRPFCGWMPRMSVSVFAGQPSRPSFHPQPQNVHENKVRKRMGSVSYTHLTLPTKLEV